MVFQKFMEWIHVNQGSFLYLLVQVLTINRCEGLFDCEYAHHKNAQHNNVKQCTTHSTAQQYTEQYSNAHHNNAQHNNMHTTQHNNAQHNTTIAKQTSK